MENIWKLEDIPAYSGGELNPTLFNCGSGMKDDFCGPTDEDSFMHIVTKTTEEEFADYCAVLEQNGYTTVFENRNDAGVFRQLKGEKLLYVYYIFNEHTARIICDNSGVSVPEFAGESGNTVHGDTALMQFGLYYGDNISGYTSDCGMLYAIRLRDNKVIVIDGGSREQSTEPATDEFMARLSALTDHPDTIHIAAWFCTHPHDDHLDFFSRMLRKFGTRLKVERVMFNFASTELLMNGANLQLPPERIPPFRPRAMERILSNNPDVSYLKLHTGQKFMISGAEVEVLLTHEDMLTRCRDKVYFGMNDTCPILKFSFDGKSMIFLADISTPTGNVLIGRYPWGSLSCDFMQVAHHCINDVANIYEFIPTEYMLVPQGRYLLLKYLSENFHHLWHYCSEYDVYVAGDATMIFHITNGKVVFEEFFPVCGCPYDGSEP